MTCMMQTTQTPATPATTVPRATARVAERPPILEPTRALGLNDSQLARALGLTRRVVSVWRLGIKPIPHVRQLQMIFLVTSLTGVIRTAFPLNSRYARRAAIARDAAIAWTELARDELNE